MKCLAPLLIFGTIGSAAQTSLRVQPGMRAPSFSLTSVRHGRIDLAEFRENVVLLSFISTDQGSSLCRSQIVFLKSIYNQYHSEGVKVLLIDAPSVQSRQPAQPDDLLNFTFDWTLDKIPLLEDDSEGSVAHRYGVRDLPTTILVSKSGVLVDRWDGLATTAQLAMALRQSLRPLNPDQKEADNCSGTVVRRAVFSGLPPARPLGDHIWVIEDEEPWIAGQAKTLRWVVLKSGSEAQSDRVRLVVTERLRGTGDVRNLLDVVMDPLPEEEAKPMTRSLDDSFAAVYLETVAVTYLEAGCHDVEARVTDSVSGSMLSRGGMSISVAVSPP